MVYCPAQSLRTLHPTALAMRNCWREVAMSSFYVGLQIFSIPIIALYDPTHSGQGLARLIPEVSSRLQLDQLR